MERPRRYSWARDYWGFIKKLIFDTNEVFNVFSRVDFFFNFFLVIKISVKLGGYWGTFSILCLAYMCISDIFLLCQEQQE